MSKGEHRRMAAKTRHGRGVRRPQTEMGCAAQGTGHEGLYRPGAEFRGGNQHVIAKQCDRQGSLGLRGAVRCGRIAAGGNFCRCGHWRSQRCMWATAAKAGRYHCHGALVNHGHPAGASHSVGFAWPTMTSARRCWRVLEPLGNRFAAVEALEAQTSEGRRPHKRQLDLALQQGALLGSAMRRRQYDAVDPDESGWSPVSLGAPLETRRCRVVHRLEGRGCRAPRRGEAGKRWEREGAAAPDAARRRSGARLVRTRRRRGGDRRQRGSWRAALHEIVRCASKGGFIPR